MPVLYDDNPALSSVPLASEEVETLLLTDGSIFARNPARVRHLLSRMRATFAFELQERRALQRDIEGMHADARTRGTPVAAALDALRALSIEEQRRVFDLRAQVLLEEVTAARSSAQRAKVAAANETNRARFALASVLEDAALGDDVRDRLRAAAALLPPAVLPQPLPGPADPGATAPGRFSVLARDEGDLSAELFGPLPEAGALPAAAAMAPAGVLTVIPAAGPDRPRPDGASATDEAGPGPATVASAADVGSGTEALGLLTEPADRQGAFDRASLGPFAFAATVANPGRVAVSAQTVTAGPPSPVRAQTSLWDTPDTPAAGASDCSDDSTFSDDSSTGGGDRAAASVDPSQQVAR
jgi:hypothetical protein